MTHDISRTTLTTALGFSLLLIATFASPPTTAATVTFSAPKQVNGFYLGFCPGRYALEKCLSGYNPTIIKNGGNSGSTSVTLKEERYRWYICIDTEQEGGMVGHGTCKLESGDTKGPVTVTVKGSPSQDPYHNTSYTATVTPPSSSACSFSLSGLQGESCSTIDNRPEGEG